MCLESITTVALIAVGATSDGWSDRAGCKKASCEDRREAQEGVKYGRGKGVGSLFINVLGSCARRIAVG
jgi:hypothetical protein